MDTFMNLNIRFIKWGSYWWPRNNNKKEKIFYAIYNSICILGTPIFMTFTEFLVVHTTIGNMDHFMKNINMALTELMGLVKICLFYWKRQEIYYILDTLRSNALLFKKEDGFDPDELVKGDIREKTFFVTYYLVNGMCVGGSACVLTFLEMYQNHNEYWQEIEVGNSTRFTYTQPLPYSSWIPWDPTTSKSNYAYAAFMQSYLIFYSGILIPSFDTLFNAMISYVGCQLKILQEHFRTIRPRVYKRLDLEYKDVMYESPEVDAELQKELIKGIKALQTIFDLCDRLENIFTYVTLAQVLVSLTVLCSCLYLVSSVPVSSEKFWIEAIYLMAIEVQLGIYCYFGNKVTLRGEDIPLSLYEGDWYAASDSFKRSMMITMTRMRRPIHLTVGKFTPLTLSTFVTIGRGSYSFFAVIKSQNDVT